MIAGVLLVVLAAVVVLAIAAGARRFGLDPWAALAAYLGGLLVLVVWLHGGPS